MKTEAYNIIYIKNRNCLYINVTEDSRLSCFIGTYSSGYLVLGNKYFKNYYKKLSYKTIKNILGDKSNYNFVRKKDIHLILHGRSECLTKWLQKCNLI